MGEIQGVPAYDVRKGDFVQFTDGDWRVVLDVKANGDGRIYIFTPGRGEITMKLGCDPDEIIRIKPRKE